MINGNWSAKGTRHFSRGMDVWSRADTQYLTLNTSLTKYAGVTFMILDGSRLPPDLGQGMDFLH